MFIINSMSVIFFSYIVNYGVAVSLESSCLIHFKIFLKLYNVLYDSYSPFEIHLVLCSTYGSEYQC